MNKNKPVVPLSLVKPGTPVVLEGITGGLGLRRRLEGMGLSRGSRFSVVQNLGPGPCVIAVGEARMALGHGMSGKILVRERG